MRHPPPGSYGPVTRMGVTSFGDGRTTRVTEARDRYAQCDHTCTTDCGACKGGLRLPLGAVRAWAIQQGLPGVGARGPVGYDAQLAYARAHNLPDPPRTERVPVVKRQRKFTGATCDCGRRWEGHVECHCKRCHRHFRSVITFDMHLVPVPATDGTMCADPERIVYRSGKHKGERKMRRVRAHHGDIYVRAEERPDQESIFHDLPADE